MVKATRQVVRFRNYEKDSMAITQPKVDLETRELHEHKQIALLAYTLWHARGCPDGLLKNITVSQKGT